MLPQGGIGGEESHSDLRYGININSVTAVQAWQRKALLLLGQSIGTDRPSRGQSRKTVPGAKNKSSHCKVVVAGLQSGDKLGGSERRQQSRHDHGGYGDRKGEGGCQSRLKYGRISSVQVRTKGYRSATLALIM